MTKDDLNRALTLRLRGVGTPKAWRQMLVQAKMRAYGKDIDYSSAQVEPCVDDGILFYDVMAYSRRFMAWLPITYSTSQGEAIAVVEHIRKYGL